MIAQVTDNRLCIRLKDLRRARRLTLSAMHETTGIAMHHLNALEECNYELLPVGAVRRAIIKKYLAALHENTEITEEYHHEIHPPIAHHALSKKRNGIFTFSFTRSALIGIGGMIIAFYLALEVHAMIAPPSLSLINPLDASVTREDTIVVSGNTAPETTVTINGTKIALAKNGSFKEVVNLKNGINDLIISAVSKRGATTKISRRVVVQKEL